MPYVNCDVCGKNFYKRPAHIKNHQNNFCSNECKISFSKKGKEVFCDNCGKKIYRKNFELNRYKTYFCSKECRGNHKRELSPRNSSKLQRKQIEYFIDENGCHICTSHYKDKDGYPKIVVNYKLLSISRYIYQQKFGEIPEGIVIRHKCDNTNCINIEHLEEGTVAENNGDTLKRNRANFSKGENHYLSKLNEKIVKEIRKSNLNNTALAKQYNVDRKAIEAVRKFRTWKHII